MERKSIGETDEVMSVHIPVYTGRMTNVKRIPQTCRGNLSWWHLLDHQKHKSLIQMNIQLDCILFQSMEPSLSFNEDPTFRPRISILKWLESVGGWMVESFPICCWNDHIFLMSRGHRFHWYHQWWMHYPDKQQRHDHIDQWSNLHLSPIDPILT